MIKDFAYIFCLLALLWGCEPQKDNQMTTLTPVLFVEKIEPSLDFWEKTLGWDRVTEVPGEDGLGFVYLMKDGAGVMYQTYPSLEEDLPGVAEKAKGAPNFIFVKVDKLEGIIEKLKDFDVAISRRTTFYGADEIGYKEPGGHYVVFAEFKEEAPSP